MYVTRPIQQIYKCIMHLPFAYLFKTDIDPFDCAKLFIALKYCIPYKKHENMAESFRFTCLFVIHHYPLLFLPSLI